MGNRLAGYKIMGCPRCGGNKTSTTHTFGTYRVYFRETNLKFCCKTCGYIIKERIIEGGQNND